MYNFGVYRKLNTQDTTRLELVGTFDSFQEAKKVTKKESSTMILLIPDSDFTFSNL